MNWMERLLQSEATLTFKGKEGSNLIFSGSKECTLNFTSVSCMSIGQRWSLHNELGLSEIWA